MLDEKKKHLLGKEKKRTCCIRKEKDCKDNKAKQEDILKSCLAEQYGINYNAVASSHYVKWSKNITQAAPDCEDLEEPKSQIQGSWRGSNGAGLEFKMLIEDCESSKLRK